MEKSEYTVVVKLSSLYGLLKYYNLKEYKKLVDIDVVGNPEFIVKYSLEPQEKNWGLSQIDIDYHSIVSSIQFYINTENISGDVTKDVLEKTKGTIENDNIVWTMEFNSTRDSWTIENTAGFSKKGSFMIDYVELDFSKKIIQIS
jgi:hypothetical protein